MNIKEALAKGLNVLRSTSDAPQLDSERLLLFVLKKRESAWLITHDNTDLSESDANRYLRLLKQRAHGLPLAYIISYQQFLGRTFEVNDNVLIPRPATEKLITAAIPVIKKLHSRLNRPLNIADIGTGSGCIAISLALALPDSIIKNIFAADISSHALRVAKRNADNHKVHNRITFKQGYLLQPLAKEQIDLIVSNPPYVPTEELVTAKQTPSPATAGLKFEPRAALDGGPDGQRFIKDISNTKTPAILETTGGLIQQFNLQDAAQK